MYDLSSCRYFPNRSVLILTLAKAISQDDLCLFLGIDNIGSGLSLRKVANARYHVFRSDYPQKYNKLMHGYDKTG